MNIVEEKQVEKLTKEEKLLLALNEVNNMHLYNKAKTLFKKELYSKDVVENFDEDAYVEVSPKLIKGYSLLTNEMGELLLVKALKADSETDVYGVEVLSLANVSEEEMKLLQDYKKEVCVVKVVLLSLFGLLLAIGFYNFLYNLFENLKNASTGELQLSDALTVAFFYAGGFTLVGLGLLLLFLKSPKKCCKK